MSQLFTRVQSYLLSLFGRAHPAVSAPQPGETKMAFQLSTKSRERLRTVQPRLQRIVERAIEITTVDFAVTQGLRTLDEQMRLYGQGRTQQQCKAMGVPVEYAKPAMKKVTWVNPRNGNHLTGAAVDVAPYVNGKLEWDDNGKLGLWPKINAAFMQAAREQGVALTWGGTWTKPDRPHFELKKE